MTESKAMEEDEKKDGDKSETLSQKEKSEEEKASDGKEPTENEGLEVPSPRQDSSSTASEDVSGEDPFKQDNSKQEDLEDEKQLRMLRCLTSSFLAGARCSLHSKKSDKIASWLDHVLIFYCSKFTKCILILIIAPESQALESDYFYKINAIRAKEKTGPFTDVSTFDRNDGVIVDQSISQLQQGDLSANSTNSCY